MHAKSFFNTLLSSRRALRAMLGAGFLTLAAPAAVAQFDQTINVEGKYLPEVIQRDRISLFPAREKLSVAFSPLEFSTSGVNASFAPQGIPMPATGWNTSRRFSSLPGYVSLSMGAWLNTGFEAGYRIIDTGNSTLGVRLSHLSTSLAHPRMSEKTEGVKRFMYDETIGLYGSRTFAGKGRFDASADYRYSYFNYYGYNPSQAPDDARGLKAPTQSLNDATLRLGWSSPAAIDNITYFVKAGARYFGYRTVPVPYMEHVDATRETDVNLAAGVSFPTSASSALGIDLDSHLLLYAADFADNENYGLLTLTPYYRFTRNNVNVRVGARLDFAFNAGPDADRYNTFHAAPSVTVDWKGGPVAICLRALGGTSLHTLAEGADRDFYQSPALLSTLPVYAPLDASLSLGFGPFAGFSATASIGWRIARGQYLGGRYMQWLNDTPVPFLPGEPNPLASLEARSNMAGISVGLALSQDFGRYFKVSAEADWQEQSGYKAYFSGYDMPRWRACISAETNPWSSLRFRLAYNYRGVRAYGLPDVTLLNFYASYGITDRLTVNLAADNLIGRRYMVLPSLPSQGLSLSAGLSFLF